jgi:regulator of protease activity HflC (stomatin/prohibitin superfamily)
MKKKGQMEILGTMGVALFIIVVVLIWGINIVQFNEYAYEKEFGKLSMEQKKEGFNWVGFGSLVRVNNQNRVYEIKANTASKDMQDVVVIFNLNMKLKSDQAYNYIRNYESEEAYMNYLKSKLQEKVKPTVLRFDASEILNNRLTISKDILSEVQNIKELDYFEINDLAISDITFSEEYSKTLEKNAQVLIEQDILLKQRENMKLMKENMQILDVDSYFKYQLIEKWDGKSPLIISDALLYR